MISNKKIKPLGFEINLSRGCVDVIHADGSSRGGSTGAGKLTATSWRQAMRIAKQHIGTRPNTAVDIKPLFGPVAS
jgi:hypothetical protein